VLVQNTSGTVFTPVSKRLLLLLFADFFLETQQILTFCKDLATRIMKAPGYQVSSYSLSLSLSLAHSHNNNNNNNNSRSVWST
jgi:hypothetical protein